MFKRKIYNEILEWKEKRSDKYALLIKGARRVGKSTVAEEFAKKEYKSDILIDFSFVTLFFFLKQLLQIPYIYN